MVSDDSIAFEKSEDSASSAAKAEIAIRPHMKISDFLMNNILYDQSDTTITIGPEAYGAGMREGAVSPDQAVPHVIVWRLRIHPHFYVEFAEMPLLQAPSQNNL